MAVIRGYRSLSNHLCFIALSVCVASWMCHCCMEIRWSTEHLNSFCVSRGCWTRLHSLQHLQHLRASRMFTITTLMWPLRIVPYSFHNQTLSLFVIFRIYCIILIACLLVFNRKLKLHFVKKKKNTKNEADLWFKMRRKNGIPEFWVQYDHFYKIIFGVIVYYIYMYHMCRW